MPTRITYIDGKRHDLQVSREGAIWIVRGLYFARAIEVRARSEGRALQRWHEAAQHRLAELSDIVA